MNIIKTSTQLREYLFQIALNPPQENRDEIDAKICRLCQDVLNEPLEGVEGVLLLRSMHEFMNAGIDGLKEGKASIRKCYDCFSQIIPKEIEASEVEILYPVHNSQFLSLFGTKTLSFDVLSYLTHLHELDEPMKKMLYAVLDKSGAQINEYLLLIGKALGLKNDSGLTHRHLLQDSDEDTVGLDDEEEDTVGLDDEEEDTVGLDDEEMVVDYKLELAVLDMLNQEPDGGYSLLKGAEFLSLGGAYDLMRCIKAIKNHDLCPDHAGPRNELLDMIVQIHPGDRVDVLMDVLALKERWKITFDSEALRYRLLMGIGAIPPEKRDRVLTLLPTYDSHLDLCRLGPCFNGIIAAYVLYPFLSKQETFDTDTWRKIMTAILWEKLLDHSLPVFTLTALARFVQTIGMPGHHPIRLLGQIMRNAGLIEPERSEFIHAKLEEHFDHLSTYRCPFEEMELKRKAEDPEDEEGPIQKKLHFS